MPSIQLRTKAAELLGKRLMLFSEQEEQSKEAFEVKITVVEQDKGEITRRKNGQIVKERAPEAVKNLEIQVTQKQKDL